MSGCKERIRAVGLLSGGLDSTLAARLMLDQGIEVFAINFTSPFCTCTPRKAGCAAVVTAVRELGNVPLKRVALGDGYLEIVRNPKHGRGSGMNPCIDCRIMKIRKAGEYMREMGASFLFTGEVLGQRPMSQHLRALKLIDRESGFEGYVLRPLSAVHLDATIPEKTGLVDRRKMLAIRGRSRKIQIKLAFEKGVRNYHCPAGGCLLTDAHFSEKLRDYFSHTARPSMKDVPLLRIGRHIRIDGHNKLIVARDERECKMLQRLHRKEDHLFEPLDFSGPTVILQGDLLDVAVNRMLRYTKPLDGGEKRIAYLHDGERTEKRIDPTKHTDSH